MRIRLLGVGAAMALVLPTLGAAAPITATVRVEGVDATVLPPTPITVDDAPGATMTVADSTDTDTVTVPASSALAQLARATTASGLPLAFQNFSFGAQILRIGAATAPGATPPFWRLKVNGTAAPVGAGDYLLAAGDSVSWALVSDFDAHELDLAVSGDTYALGTSFTATVTSVDNTGAVTPAAGATVTYGDQAATAGPSGRVSFATTTAGVQFVQATRSGEVRSQRRAICAFGADPTICSLPPAKVVKSDTVAPGSEVVAPVSGRSYRRVSRIRGVVSPDRSDIAAVDVAIGRRVGTLCAFMGPKGYFGAPRPCSQRRFVPARVSGTNWVLVPRRPLTAGKYIVWAQATDGADNRESVALSSINVIAFTISSRARARV